jgi:hypothetical protein
MVAPVDARAAVLGLAVVIAEMAVVEVAMAQLVFSNGQY